MNAHDARERAQEVLAKRYSDTMSKVNDQINAAVEAGKFSVTVNLDISDDTAAYVVTQLRKENYSVVQQHSNWRNENNWKLDINWREPQGW